MEQIKGFKVFNADLTCRGYQFAIGETFHQAGEIKLCDNGFHFCRKLVDCFNYYTFYPSNRVCEVVGFGDIDDTNSDKVAVSDITIIRELTWQEVLTMVNLGNGNTGINNAGNRNSGNYNTGNCNSGSFNTGYCNSGNWNSGNYNSGFWNSGNWNSGHFNDDTSDTIRVFGVETPAYEYQEWANNKPSFLFFKIEDGESFKDAAIRSWNAAPQEERDYMLKCPNFNAEKFYNIFGIVV